MDSKINISLANDDYLKFKIVGNKSNYLLQIFLVLLILFCVIFPLSILFIDELEVGFGYIITLAIFFGTAVFLGRKYLWTFHGGEVFEIKSSTLNHYFDYRFFKDGNTKQTFSKASIGYSSLDNPNEIIEGVPSVQSVSEEVYLGIILDGYPIKSNLTLYPADVIELSKVL